VGVLEQDPRDLVGPLECREVAGLTQNEVTRAGTDSMFA